MSKFKVGDEIVLKYADFIDKCRGYKRGDKFKITDIVHVHNMINNDHGFEDYQIEKINSEYENSNRYKLQQAIKKTGFHAEKLSLASNHAKTYFTGFTAESRFNSRGDITEERLNSLLTTLAFAERKLLELAPKTVDENNVPMVEKSIDESVVEAKSALDSFLIDNETWFLEDNKIKDNKSKKFLIVFVLLVIILAVYFFTR